MNEIKKKIIYICITIILCIGSFTLGRTTRVRGIESNSGRIEQSIIEQGIRGAEAEKLSDDIGIIGGNIQSSNELAIERIEESERRTAELESIIDECFSITEISKSELNNSIKRIESAIGTTEYILELAAIKAEQDERTLQRLTEVIRSSHELYCE